MNAIVSVGQGCCTIDNGHILSTGNKMSNFNNEITAGNNGPISSSALPAPHIQPGPSVAAASGSIIDYKEKYRALKNKFKFLVFENECYQEELRNLQRKLLKLSRDKNFLLDRLLHYERAEESSEDSEATLPSEDEAGTSNSQPKRKASRPEPTPEQKAKRRRADAARRKRQKELQMQKAASVKSEDTGHSSNISSLNPGASSTSYQPPTSTSMVSQSVSMDMEVSSGQIQNTSPMKSIQSPVCGTSGNQSFNFNAGTLATANMAQIGSPPGRNSVYGTVLAGGTGNRPFSTSTGSVGNSISLPNATLGSGFYPKATTFAPMVQPNRNQLALNRPPLMEHQQYQIEQTLVSSSAVTMSSPALGTPSAFPTNFYSPKSAGVAGSGGNYGPTVGPIVSSFPMPSISPQAPAPGSIIGGPGCHQSHVGVSMNSGGPSPVNCSPIAATGHRAGPVRFVTPTASPNVGTPGSSFGGGSLGGSGSVVPSPVGSGVAVTLLPLPLPDTSPK